MIILYVLFLGLCLGSFVNALVWRLKTRRDWVHERSICPHCKKSLAARDLVPVVSWLALGGKCRRCKAPISPQYPLVELLTGLAFVISYVFWPQDFGVYQYVVFGSWLALLTVLIALAVYDLKYMLLPNKLVAAGAIPVVIASVAGFIAEPNMPSQIVGISLGVMSFGGIFYVLFQISDGRWIGGGDVKLGFVLGAWLASPALSLIAIVAASWLGLFATGVMYLLKRKVTMTTQIPFGPMLIAGTFMATLWGQKLLDTYLSLMTV